jgi:hypothetical protein
MMGTWVWRKKMLFTIVWLMIMLAVAYHMNVNVQIRSPRDPMMELNLRINSIPREVRTLKDMILFQSFGKAPIQSDMNVMSLKEPDLSLEQKNKRNYVWMVFLKKCLESKLTFVLLDEDFVRKPDQNVDVETVLSQTVLSIFYEDVLKLEAVFSSDFLNLVSLQLFNVTLFYEDLKTSHLTLVPLSAQDNPMTSGRGLIGYAVHRWIPASGQ